MGLFSANGNKVMIKQIMQMNITNITSLADGFCFA